MPCSPRISATALSLCIALAHVSPGLAQTQPATAPVLLPIPAPLGQDHASFLIHSLFKTEYARTQPADRQTLAKRLLTEAAGTRDDPAARYVLLTESTNLAALAGDPVTSLKAATELGRLYQVNLLDLKKQALVRTTLFATAVDAQQSLATLALDTAEEAALQDDFAATTDLASLAQAAADKTQKVQFVLTVQQHVAELTALAHDYPQVQQALAAAQNDPHDHAAEFLVGQFYALRKGQWSLGLPHLARSNDDTLKMLAIEEQLHPTDGVAQASLGDRWWNYSLTVDGRMRRQVQRHACDWYRLAAPNLAGLTLTRIESRLHATSATQPATALALPTSGGGTPLLSLIDLTKDVGAGKWTMTNGALECAPGLHACVALPYSVPDEYDLRITFMRTDGDAPITVLLASHNKSFGFALDVKGDARFERVDNKIAKDNPTTAPVAVSNNRKYTLTLQLRNDMLRALLDDKLVTQWKTDYKDLARYAVWKLPLEKSCGIGVNNGHVIFYAIDLVETSGKGRPLR